MPDRKEVFKEYWWVSLCLIGLLIRYLWPLDMQWKADQIYMWEHAMSIASGNGWEWLGMPSGVAVRNPGMSVWFFTFFALFCSEPIDMLNWVISVNVLAIIGYWYFIRNYIPSKEKDIWYWGLAITCVNPMAIFFSRDIWAQDVLPIITFAIICSLYFRNRRTGAFFWGFFGSILGQVHMAGFFFSLGLFLFFLYRDLREGHKTNWLFWVLGSLAGSSFMIPWLIYAFEFYSQKKPGIPAEAKPFELSKHFSTKFYYYAIYDSIGVHMRYMMGGKAREFWNGPKIYGVNTYLSGLCYVFLVGTVLYKLKFFAFKLKEIYQSLKSKTFLKEMNFMDQLIWATVLGLGVVLTLSGITIYPHYLICCYPLIFMWLGKIIYPQKKLFLAILVTQVFISFTMLLYIHQNEGVDGGDYGRTYRSIMRDKTN